MRQLIEDKIRAAATDGADLSDLEFASPTTVKDLPNLSDEDLLDVYDSLFGFNG